MTRGAAEPPLASTPRRARRGGRAAGGLAWGGHSRRRQPAPYHGLVASTRLLLDDPGAAVAEASRAIALAEATPPGARHLYAELLVRTDQAQAYRHQPDLDGAAAALRLVLVLRADMRAEPILQQLHRLRRSLVLPQLADAPPARELQDEIETYDREAVVRQITA